MEFKGTGGDWGKELSELKPIIEFSKNLTYVSTDLEFVALIFGNTKEELESNTKLIEQSKEMLFLLQRFIENNMMSVTADEEALVLINKILK